MVKLTEEILNGNFSFCAVLLGKCRRVNELFFSLVHENYNVRGANNDELLSCLMTPLINECAAVLIAEVTIVGEAFLYQT